MTWRTRAKDLTVSNPGSTTDEYNNTVPDWAHPTNATERGLIQETQSTEVTDGRDTVVTDKLCILPVDSSVTSYSRIIDGSVTYEVVGQPTVYDTGSPGVRHTEARIVTVTG